MKREIGKEKGRHFFREGHHLEKGEDPGGVGLV